MPDTPSPVSLDPGLTFRIGEHSRIEGQKIRNPSGAHTSVSIGRFSFIGSGLTIVATEPKPERIAVYPFLDETLRSRWPAAGDLAQDTDPESGQIRDTVSIGNDVWIGENVSLLRGVVIGDGAVINASSRVTASVASYTIVAGVPAVAVRKRFTDEEIQFLEKARWWDWPAERINRHLAVLCGGDFAALERVWNEESSSVNDERRLGALRLSANQSLKDGRFADAARKYSALLEHNPGDLMLLLQLGKALCQVQDYGSAKWCYERVLALDPANSIAVQALARLQGGDAARGRAAIHN